MLFRMILALLLAAFATPGAASACHDGAPAAMPMAHRMQHDAPRRDTAIAPHACLGCIPPASLATRAIVAPIPAARLPRRIVAVAFDRGLSAPPALPPPRLAA